MESSITINVSKGQLRAALLFAGGFMAGTAYAVNGDVTALVTTFQGLTGIGISAISAVWTGFAWATTTKETAPPAVS